MISSPSNTNWVNITESATTRETLILDFENAI
jgi:hypothetical protein